MMLKGDGNRIRNDVIGVAALRSLRDANRRVQMHQLHLATGGRVNEAIDDVADRSRAVTLSARSRTLSQIVGNIGDAKQMVESLADSLADFQQDLAGIRERVMQAANDTLTDDARQAITGELLHMRDTLDSIASETTFNGTHLLGSSTAINFQTGETSQTTMTTTAHGVDDLGMTALAGMTDDDVVDADNYQTYLEEVDEALSRVSSGISDLGALSGRLDYKERTISIRQANTEAVLSRIADKDLATEQLELVKAKIAQQVSLAVLAHRNLSREAITELRER